MSESDPNAITITTICNGGVPDVFARELAGVLANIADPNTEAGTTRGLTLKFTFKPLDDRSGAIVSFSCRPVLQPVKVATSPVFLSRHSGQLQAYALDHRQVSLFGGADAEKKPMSIVK
jgi:hypothetical protein